MRREFRRALRTARRRNREDIARLAGEVRRAELFLAEISAMLDPDGGKVPPQTQGGPA